MDDAGFEHDVVHTNHSGAIIALETKLGTGDSNATSGAVLVGTGSGTSAWDTTPTFDGVSPTGAVVMWSGSSAPSGWLECDGSAVSRTTYSALFAVIGTRYGTGDGSSTFNLPNPVDRVAMGIALSTSPTATTLSVSSSLDSLSLGNQSADHSHTITSNSGNQSANHSHTITSNAGNQSASHSHSGSTGNESSTHTHNVSNQTANHSHSYVKPNSGSTGNANTGNNSASHKHNLSNQSSNHTHNFNTGNQSANHNHTITSNAGNQSASHSHTITSNAGNQSANHNHALSSSSITSSVNVEPFGFIIKT
jgi:microcystin-dependent protein